MTAETLPAVQNGNGHMPAPASVVFTEKKLELIRRTVAAECKTPDEFDLFIATAQRLCLDPQLGEIRCIRFGGNLAIFPGINGYRKRVTGHREFRGWYGPWWCGPDGEWRDAWLEEKPPAACKIGLLRAGHPNPTYTVARYKSYVNSKNPKWSTSPDLMLEYCAVRKVVSMVFPNIIDELDAECGASAGDDGEYVVDAVVDPETGEMLSTPGPAYTDEKDNAHWMRKIHKAGDDKGLDHEGIHKLVVAIFHYPNLGPTVTSLADLTDEQYAWLLGYIERRPPETLAALPTVYEVGAMRGMDMDETDRVVIEFLATKNINVSAMYELSGPALTGAARTLASMPPPEKPAITDGSWTSTNGAAEHYDNATEAHSQQEPPANECAKELATEEDKPKPASRSAKQDRESDKTQANAPAVKCQACKKATITDEQARLSHEAFGKRLCGPCAVSEEIRRRERNKPLANVESVPDAAEDEDVFDSNLAAAQGDLL